MSRLDLLLHIDSYPDPTPTKAIEQAVRFAAGLGASLTALAVEIDLPAPSNWIADRLANLSSLCAEQEAQSLAACRAALDTVTGLRLAHGVHGGSERSRAEYFRLGEHVAVHARTHDLCLVPMTDRLDGQRAVAEDVVFGSGRPVLLFRPDVAALPIGSYETAVVAWDGTRTAARAMADALPLLRLARAVRVVTVSGDTPKADVSPAEDARRYLETHGVAATVESVAGDDRPVGAVLSAYAAAHRAQLLVMGAYGHSRAREFILGGATEYLLHDPKVALLLSH